MSNENKFGTEIEAFYKEAQRRGVYTQAQDSLIATWKTLSTSVLPEMGIDLSKTTVADLKEKLPGVLQAYGAKSNVKASTIQTYQIKGQRLLTDFLEYSGAADAAWFAWKQKAEKKSAQAKGAATTRFSRKASRDEGPRDVAEPPPMPGMKKHPLKLPGGRGAELHVPDDLQSTDIMAMQRQFTALMSYLQAQIDAEVEPEE